MISEGGTGIPFSNEGPSLAKCIQWHCPKFFLRNYAAISSPLENLWNKKKKDNVGITAGKKL